jgi:hypothetical protein
MNDDFRRMGTRMMITLMLKAAAATGLLGIATVMSLHII